MHRVGVNHHQRDHHLNAEIGRKIYITFSIFCIIISVGCSWALTWSTGMHIIIFVINTMSQAHGFVLG